MLKTLAELTDTDEPAIKLIREWAAAAENDCVILPPSPERDEVLLEVQVTTHSTMGAVAHETGGILVDHGWLRFLGSGHPRLTRTLPAWNRDRGGFYLIADDAIGGFFALNGGAFGDNQGSVYYWPPDSLDWEALGVGYADFLHWSLSSKLSQFYENFRWPSWIEDVANLSCDCCFSFYPFLWTNEGSLERSVRHAIPIAESFNLKVDLLRQLGA